MKPTFSSVSEWVLASHNAGKIKELANLLEPYGLIARGASEMGLSDPEETEKTFEGNAILKAKAAAEVSGRVSLADDSGLCVIALNAAPGIYSARWAGEPRDFGRAMERVWTEMGAEACLNPSAYFISVIALVHPDGDVLTYEGRCEGRISWPPRGTNGFGYDSVFVPDGYDRTFAEMSDEEKKALSHRARAFTALVRDVFEP